MSFRLLTLSVAQTLKPGAIYVVCNGERDESDELTGQPNTASPWLVVIDRPVEDDDTRIKVEFCDSGDSRGAAWDTAELYDFECEEEGQPAAFCSGSGADPVWILA